MYNWIDKNKFDNNKKDTLAFMCKSASGVFTIKKGLKIRHRDSKHSSSYDYDYDFKPQVKWGPYSIQMCAASIQFDISSCNTSYHFKMRDLSTQVLDYDSEERSKLYKRNKKISGTLNDDSMEAKFSSERLYCDSSKVPPNPPKAPYRLVPALAVIAGLYS